MVLTIVILDSAGMVDNWIMTRTDPVSDLPAESAARYPPVVGICGRIPSGADGDNGDGDGDGDGDGNGVGDGDRSTGST